MILMLLLNYKPNALDKTRFEFSPLGKTFSMGLKRIVEEKSGHLDYKDFLKMYNYCTEEPYSFMTIDARPTATNEIIKRY